MPPVFLIERNVKGKGWIFSPHHKPFPTAEEAQWYIDHAEAGSHAVYRVAQYDRASAANPEE